MSAESGSRKARYLSAAVAIPCSLAICVFLPVLFNLTVIILVTIGIVEFYAMARNRGYAPHSVIGTTCALAVCFIAWMGRPLTLLYALMASTIIVCTFAMARNIRDAMANIAVTVFGLVYVGWFSSYVILLRQLPVDHSATEIEFGGAGYVIMLLILLWLGDGGAFFTGTAWGRHKLAPAISPNKSVEGSIGGIALTLIGALLIRDAGVLLHTFGVALFPSFNYTTYLLIGLGIAIAGQIGDLVESYLKRDAGLKDTGNLFPGHGGFLDRFDSLIFAAPLLYFFLEFVKNS